MEEYMDRHVKMGGAAAIAAFESLMDRVTDPATGQVKMVLKKGIKTSDAVRIFEAGTRVEREAVVESRKELSGADVTVRADMPIQAAGQVVINLPRNGYENVRNE